MTTLMSGASSRRTQGEAGGEDHVGKDWWAYQVDPPPELSQELGRRKGF